MLIKHSSPWISGNDIRSVNSNLHSGMIAHGTLVEEFENCCAAYLGQSYAHATSSGQAAIERALLALDIQKGSEVVMPSYVCRSVEDAVNKIGATPIYCDVGEDWCINAATVEAVLSPSTAAIIAVHTFGVFADVGGLLSFGVPIIEDCSQCFSPCVGDKGAISVFSFHATKCLTTGEGGLVATSDLDIAEKIKNSLQRIPEGARMSDIQAALGISQLVNYSSMLERRIEIASIYLNALPEVSLKRVKKVKDRSIFFRFPLTVKCGFNLLAPSFEQQGVQVRHGVDNILHRRAGVSDKRFPCTLDMFNETLSLPIYPALSDLEIEKVLAVGMEVLG